MSKVVHVIADCYPNHYISTSATHTYHVQSSAGSEQVGRETHPAEQPPNGLDVAWSVEQVSWTDTKLFVSVNTPATELKHE